VGSAKKHSLDVNLLAQGLVGASSEEEVRLNITTALGITTKLKVIGATDGVCDGTLFEFKFDKTFFSGAVWRKGAYSALAQALYYCRRILNFEVDELFEMPHSIVICDKNGGFVLPTKQFESLLQFDPATFASRKEVVETLQSYFGREWLKVLNENPFSWDTPPSQQDEGLARMLETRKALSDTQYLDFSDKEQLIAFLRSAGAATGERPIISVTKQNFVGIFDRWFLAFAPAKASRREWADRFVIDLRKQYLLDTSTGTLRYKSDKWNASVEIYREFWKIYKRPPEDAVDQFIATNKDLLYDVDDQNNHGDFYTPVRLANLAQRLLAKHLPTKGKHTTWWDPAAGGGNLFFRFSDAQDVVLSTKFKADCDGLKSNPSVSGSFVMQLDFVNELLEIDLTKTAKWKQLREKLSAADQLVFFLNPPFDDQAESRGTNESIPQGFIQHEDAGKIYARSLRSMHTRFFYRILSLARTLEKPVWLASFSKTAWIVGPDSQDFFSVWKNEFEFKDGLIVSSRVFNGVKEQWPCLFSVWHYNPKRKLGDHRPSICLNVYDEKYQWVGKKTLLPFNQNSIRLSEIAKRDKAVLGDRKQYEIAPPLENEYQIAEKIYDDTLPKGALGYFRFVANDVYNSAQRVQILSSMFGPSNHNGVPLVKDNFQDCLSVYGIRKSVRRTWLNDKDEFYLPGEPSQRHRNLLRKAAVFALVDGAYASSVGKLKYKGKAYDLRNPLSIPSNLELRNWGAKDLPDENSFASFWISQTKDAFSELEKDAIKAAKNLVKVSLQSNLRAKGDPERQLQRGDAGIRQLVNGLFEYDGANLPENAVQIYQDYLATKESLRAQIEKEVYSLEILMPFESGEGSSVAASITEKHADALQKVRLAKDLIRSKKLRVIGSK
jgi:hypothetical protein